LQTQGAGRLSTCGGGLDERWSGLRIGTAQSKHLVNIDNLI
jgi:hypothetical protein